MARFKTLREKNKAYAFDFLGNLNDPNPAKVIFTRFPQPGENFMPRVKGSFFEGINLEKIAQKDGVELDKFIASFMDHFSASMAKIDYEYFARECFDRFENFESDGKEIKTVDDFLSLNVEMRTLIAHDCYKYAQEKDEFTMGESTA